MKARTLAVARGERRIQPGEPKAWFTSTESFAKILSARKRELLRVIAERTPQSLEELAEITGRAKSTLSRTLRTMEQYGLVQLDRAERGRIVPRVIYDRVEPDVPLVLQRKAGEGLSQEVRRLPPAPSRSRRGWRGSRSPGRAAVARASGSKGTCARDRCGRCVREPQSNHSVRGIVFSRRSLAFFLTLPITSRINFSGR